MIICKRLKKEVSDLTDERNCLMYLVERYKLRFEGNRAELREMRDRLSQMLDRQDLHI